MAEEHEQTASGPAPVKNLFGNYEILDTIGHGGMGIVYRAMDLSLGRPVALKVLREDLRRQSHLVARFQREAEAFATLNHPNIVHIYGVGTVGRIPYIAMEYIEGLSLSAIMKKERRIPWERALLYGEQVGRALASAHDSHIIHRDIKPGNILVDKDEHAFVTDFGIAKVLTAETQLTVDGSRLGTPQYMSPERCLNQEVTASSDIYSLGVVLFQMITGRLPHEAPTPVRLIEHIIAKPPARVREYVRDVPENVERLIAFMTEKSPKDRPKDAHVLCEAIARVRAGKPLDEGGDKARAFADLRDEMGTPTPRTGSNMRAGTPARIHLKALGTWLVGQWRNTAKPLRVGLVSAVLVGISVTLSQALVGAMTAGRAFDVVRQAQGGASRWGQSGVVGTFLSEAPGVTVVQLNLPDFAVAQVSWDASQNRAALRLDGLDDTPRSHQSLLCTVEPGLRRAALAVPAATGAAGLSGPAMSLFTEGYAGGRSPSGVDGFLFLARPLLERTSGARIYAVSWEPTERPPSLVNDLSQSQHMSGERVLNINQVGALAFNAARGVMALAVSDDGVGWRIVEGRVPEPGASTDWVTVAPWGTRIVTLLYSPDGTCLAYVRRTESGTDDLRVVLLGPGEYGQEQSVMEGSLTVTGGAFSPRGDALAVSAVADDGHRTLRLIPYAGGGAVEDLGEGYSISWCPSGNAFVVTAPDRVGRCQLWSVDATPPYTRRQLTFLDTGTTTICAVSPDGKWVLSAKADAFAPALVLGDLRRLAPTASSRQVVLQEVEEGQVPVVDDQIGNDAPHDGIEVTGE